MDSRYWLPKGKALTGSADAENGFSNLNQLTPILASLLKDQRAEAALKWNILNFNNFSVINRCYWITVRTKHYKYYSHIQTFSTVVVLIIMMLASQK